MRLFVALDLPFALRQRLALLAGRGIPGARWVPAENYHLTLRFIGEIQAWQAEEIDHALAALRAPGFALTLAGVARVPGLIQADGLHPNAEGVRRVVARILPKVVKLIGMAASAGAAAAAQPPARRT